MLHEAQGSPRLSFERTGSKDMDNLRSGNQAAVHLPTTCNVNSACAHYSKRMAMLQDVTLAAPLGERQGTRRDEGNLCHITGCSLHDTLLCTSRQHGASGVDGSVHVCMKYGWYIYWPVFPPLRSAHDSSCIVVIQSLPSQIWQKL